MGEHSQPSLRDGARVIPLAAGDGFDRIEIEGHHPVQVEMGAGGDQVGDIAGALASALNEHGLHVAGMAGEYIDGNSVDNLVIAAQQLHLASFDQRIVIFV